MQKLSQPKHRLERNTSQESGLNEAETYFSGK